MGMFGEDRDVVLPSGRTLHIETAEWRVSKALYQAVAEECHTGLKLVGDDTDFALFKDALCLALYSKKIEACIWACFKTTTIDKILTSEESFKKIEHREDYLIACLEVALENIRPFAKPLSQQFGTLGDKIVASLVSQLTKMSSSSKSDSQKQDTAEEIQGKSEN